MGAKITFGTGTVGYLAGDGETGVVVVHEFWGLNAQTEGVADRFAKDGFRALAVDLYDGRVATTPAVASALMEGLDEAASLAKIDAAAAELRSRGCKRVAVLGFCMGGALTLSAAARGAFEGAVCFYGIPRKYDASAMRTPLLLHFADRDTWCTPARVKALETALAGAARTFTLHRYDAAHAFCNERRPDVHDPTQAALAFQRTKSFLSALD